MSKFISKQSVAIWYALTALFATYIVGQVILWCFPDGSSMGGSLLFILMNLIPMITALCFSIILGETKSLGEFFKKIFLQKESNLSWMLAFFIPIIYYGISILLMMFALLGTPSWTSSSISPGHFYMEVWKKSVGVGSYKFIFPLASTL